MTEISRVWQNAPGGEGVYVYHDKSDPPQYAFGYALGGVDEAWQMQMFGPMNKETAERYVDPANELDTLSSSNCRFSLTFELQGTDRSLANPEHIARQAAQMILGSQVVPR